MLPPEVTDQPPGEVYALRTGEDAERTTSTDPGLTIDELYDLALTDLPGYGPFADWNYESDQILAAAFKNEADGRAGMQRTKIKWRFFSATCYVKIWWQVVTIDEVTEAELDVSDEEFEWTPTGFGGLCIPAGWNHADQTTWPESGEIETLETEPAAGDMNVTKIRNVRWSFVPGYHPGPGDPNGFPA